MRSAGRGTLALVGFAALLACATASSLHPPAPLLHDEFSYLLAGDTFAHGRLANPSPPAWEHFETAHVLLQPSYASKYPAGQGLVLALGQVLVERPIVGVWLSMAAAAVALCWMLQGWLGGPWPLLGGLAFALHPALVEAWGNTYWGGAVACAGGALVYGALPRLIESPTRRGAAALGVGAALLALSRPFEGLVALAPTVAVLAAHLLRGGDAARRTLGASWLPLLLAFAALAAFLGAHNRAVTGSAWQLPYAEYQRQYEVVPLFVFQPLREAPPYRHAVQQRFFTRTVAWEYTRRQSAAGWLAGCWQKAVSFFRFYAGWAFGCIGLGVLLAVHERRVRFALACAGIFALALSAETFEQPHYAAPFVAVGAFLWTRGLQALWEWRGGRRAVRVAAVLIVAAGFSGQALQASGYARHRASYDIYRRPELIARLAAQPGDHLVVVRYGRAHNPHIEWVQNEADLEGARVIWAHEIDPQRATELLQRFPGRRAWLLRPDLRPDVLVPYAP